MKLDSGLPLPPLFPVQGGVQFTTYGTPDWSDGSWGFFLRSFEYPALSLRCGGRRIHPTFFFSPLEDLLQKLGKLYRCGIRCALGGKKVRIERVIYISGGTLSTMSMVGLALRDAFS
jgi:hypothetical protein